MNALIIVDMVYDFVNGPLKCDGAREIIPNIIKLANVCRARGIPVIYLNDRHLKGDKELALWGPHAMAGTEGAEVIPELKPESGDHIVPKRRYSGFFATDLDLLLSELGVTEVIFTGLLTNLCILHTAAGAYFRGYKITIPKDGVAAKTEEDHESALSHMSKFFGARILRTAKIIEELKTREYESVWKTLSKS